MSSDYYGFIAGGIADSGGKFDRMTDGEIAAHFKDRDRDREPSEPDHDAIEYERHSREDHAGKACTCPPPTRAETDAAWAEAEREHLAQAHGGGDCTCTAPF